MIVAVFAASLALVACEKAEDRQAGATDSKFDIQYCASESIEAPTRMPVSGCVVSPNKQYAFLMQSGGSLQLSQVDAKGELTKLLWSSNSRSKSAESAETQFQEDGNLVIYDTQKPIWDSHSVGKIGKYTLVVTDQGNAMIKDPAGQPLWSALFDIHLCPPKLNGPAQLASGGCIASPSKTFAMIMQKTGTLQVVPVAADGTTGKPIWSSKTNLGGKSGAPFLALQTDGNLVVYANGKPTWNSETNSASPGPYHLGVSDSGELELYRADAVIWSSIGGKIKAGTSYSPPQDAKRGA